MTLKGSHTSTPYLEYMREVINRMVGQGYHAFTQDQLATEMKVKKTTSFRARLHQLVAAQELVCWQFYNDQTGGIGKAYARPVMEQLRLPEDAF